MAEPRAYQMRPAGPNAYGCPDCGNLVTQTDIHDTWHAHADEQATELARLTAALPPGKAKK